MFNSTETDERKYLEEIKHKLLTELKHVARKVKNYSDDISAQKTYTWEHKGDMDHVEKIAARASAEQMTRSGEVALGAKRRIERLIQSPYFGRFDFKKSGEESAQPVYLGIHSYIDSSKQKSIIFDWRAPISALFYDFELGEGKYHSPGGEVRGEIELKRQFRIRGGEMEFMLESGLNILDDVLQKELSRTSDQRMKNIVATIQRDQNRIIRNEDADALIIQGVAGSGKTSIALHRVAFLLYRFKDTLRSKDVMIISPNKVFADFIANVLPELGEEKISEVEMELIADTVLGRKCRFESCLEQSSRLLERGDKELIRRIQVKGSAWFLKKLEEYVHYVEGSRFNPIDLPLRDQIIPAEFLKQAFHRQVKGSLTDRLRWVFQRVEREAWVKWRFELKGKEKIAIRKALTTMSRRATVRALYREFFTWLGDPDLFKPVRGSVFEYCDVFPLVFLKLRLEGGTGEYKPVKHLVVDEMQDYTPVQYAVIAELFPCNKTILGDINQSLNAWNASTAEEIALIFRGSECVKLCKSYRSSYEITQFAQNISPNSDLIAIERYGKKPRVVRCGNGKDEIAKILQEISIFAKQGFQTMAIICKTPKEAERLFQKIDNSVPDLHLLSASSTSFVQGVVVCSVHLAKGLEFDSVIIPHATDKHYSTELERNLLYVACTRAMHQLVLTHVGPLSPFVSDLALYEEE